MGGDRVVGAGSEAGVLVLKDGRRLGYAEYGRSGGEAFFYFHGHPGARLEARFAASAADVAGVRMVALDRPGYGLSDDKPSRTILDWPDDVAEAADLLGVGSFCVVGGSGGAPYALACAHRLPDRVVRAGLISGVGPHDVPGIAKGMRWQNRVGFRWGARWPWLARALMRSMERNIRDRPDRTIEALTRAMSPVDAAVARRPEVRALLADVVAEAFRQGSEGAARDVVLLGRPWGFSVSEIRPTVYLWQGEADVLVPPAMGRYLAARIPDCRARFLPGEGHLLVIDHMPEIVRALASTVD
jgi:pimeloyl-ACP methyl ester carboxylesterase